MAGTQSVWSDEPGILGIPRSRRTIAGVDPHHGTDWLISQSFSNQVTRHTQSELAELVDGTIVVRVQPRTFRGITDLLSPRLADTLVRVWIL